MDALLDAYSNVGEILPDLADFETKFRQHPGALVVLERYVTLVLELHSEVLQVFSRPGTLFRPKDVTRPLKLC